MDERDHVAEARPRSRPVDRSSRAAHHEHRHASGSPSGTRAAREARTLLGKYQAGGVPAGRRPHRARMAATTRRGSEIEGADAGPVGRSRQPAVRSVAVPVPLRPTLGVAGVPAGAGRRGHHRVNVLQQTARTLIAGGTAVRAIDAVTNKPEVALDRHDRRRRELKQIAAVVAGVPNIVLQQNGIESIIANDLRLTYADGLDFIVCVGLTTAGTQTLATDPLLNVIRRSVTRAVGGRVQPGHADPDPGEQRDARPVDVGRHGGLAGAVRVRRRPASGRAAVFGMNVRVSKNIAPADRRRQRRRSGSCTPARCRSRRSRRTPARRTRASSGSKGTRSFGIERLTAAVRIT